MVTYHYQVRNDNSISVDVIENNIENYQKNKRQRIPKGQSKMDNPEKLTTQGTKDEEKQSKNTKCAGHHHTETKKKKR